MSQQIKKIIIFGGGTSGWLSAAYMVNNLNLPVEIVLIEDSTLGPIGVGEGTQPGTARFLYECGIHPKIWMKDCDASFKLGVELVGWNKKPYFVDNDTFMNHKISENLFSSDYFINRHPQEFIDWHPAYNLAKNNICPKMCEDGDASFYLPEGSYGAVHFDAAKIIKTIKSLILDKITYIDTKIVNVNSDYSGITGLISQEGETYCADLYIDCTGFSSLLLDKTLKVDFHSYENMLPCDRAIAIPTQYKDPQKECFPYTRATTMNSGWRWTIPIYSRIGNGYVYSSKFISDEDAEKELRVSVNDFETPVNKLKMRCGRHDVVAYKNVCAVGLSAGFVEPLEATGITFTTSIIKSIVGWLNQFGHYWTNNVKQHINRSFYEMVTEIVAFVWAHYHFCSRDDTPFWKNIREQKMENLDDDVRFILNHHYPQTSKRMFFTNNSMFNTVHWFSVINSNGEYKGNPLTEKQELYAKYFLQTQTCRVELAKKMFPNQYDYLREWYKE